MTPKPTGSIGNTKSKGSKSETLTTMPTGTIGSTESKGGKSSDQTIKPTGSIGSTKAKGSKSEPTMPTASNGSTKSKGSKSTVQTPMPTGSIGNIFMTISSEIDVSNVFITPGQQITRRLLIAEGDFQTLMEKTVREVVKGSLNANQNLTSVITTDTKQYVNGTVAGTTAVSQLLLEEKCMIK